MGVDPMAPLDHASGLAGLGEGGVCRRDGTARGLKVPCFCPGSARAGVRCLEEPGMRPEGSNPEGMELDLDDEPGALLDFLNAHWRRVTKSMFRMLSRLPRCIELSVLDFLNPSWTVS